MLAASRNRRPTFAARGNAGGVVIWTANNNYSYLLGVNRKATIVEETIDTASNDCYNPITVKVDHAQNVWIACQGNQSGANSVLQEYSGSGTVENTYAATLPCLPSTGCVSSYEYGSDGASDATNVFAVVDYAEQRFCTSSCSDVYSTGFFDWPAGEPSASPAFISLPDTYDGKYPGVEQIGFMDLDASGNVWFDYEGCSAASSCSWSLGEIVNPTSKRWRFLSGLASRSLDQCPQGIYISTKRGTQTLNVTDDCTRKIYQYHLPVRPDSAAFNVLGPTATGLGGYGAPYSGGFNQSDSSIVEGDADAWLDVGKVSTNAWTALGNVDFIGELYGAAYTPSDK